jgi:hypothetical protein
MLKKFLGCILLFAGISMAAWSADKGEITLLMVPRDSAAAKVGMDIANRYPTLLLSYKIGARGAVSLHGWTGTQWVNVKVEDFRAGNFFRTGPESAVVIEQDSRPVPEILVPSAEWAPSVYKITTAEVRPLLHLIGRHYDFKYKDWQWFAKRHGMGVDAINPDGLNVSWYHKRLGEHLKDSNSTGTSDLEYWEVVHIPEVVLEPQAESVPVEEASEEPSVPEEHPEVPLPEDPALDPLSVDVEAAVIMGAGGAVETNGVKEVSSDMPDVSE